MRLGEFQGVDYLGFDVDPGMLVSRQLSPDAEEYLTVVEPSLLLSSVVQEIRPGENEVALHLTTGPSAVVQFSRHVTVALNLAVLQHVDHLIQVAVAKAFVPPAWFCTVSIRHVRSVIVLVISTGEGSGDVEIRNPITRGVSWSVRAATIREARIPCNVSWSTISWSFSHAMVASP